MDQVWDYWDGTFGFNGTYIPIERIRRITIIILSFFEGFQKDIHAAFVQRLLA